MGDLAKALQIKRHWNWIIIMIPNFSLMLTLDQAMWLALHMHGHIILTTKHKIGTILSISIL